jgi:type VI secretion system secreted protein VgrG
MAFLEGDPDQPLVVGSVYNGKQPPPYDLPANKTQSGVITITAVRQ